MHRALLLACLSFVLLPAVSVATEDPEREIMALIQEVADSGCQFERNGNLHDADTAADHLRSKYRRGRRYADSSENFIERLASSSSFSGRPYYIICRESGRETAAVWLQRALAELREDR